FVYMWHQILVSHLSGTWENKDIYRAQQRANRNWKCGISKGRRIHQVEGKEERKPNSALMRSWLQPCSFCLLQPWDQDSDTSTFGQILPAGVLSNVCVKTKEIMEVRLHMSQEDTTDFSVSFSDSEHSHTDSSYTLDSTFSDSSSGNLMPAPPWDHVPPPHSTFSPHMKTPSPTLTSPSSLGDFLPLDLVPLLYCKFPMDHSLSPLHHTQGADPGLKPEGPVHTIFTGNPKLILDIDLLPKLSQTKDPTDPCVHNHTPPTLSASTPGGNSTMTPSKAN
uniref:Uncharacterized protein n=1 Tax=Otolemur garnettii TaxID=30611 RepID=H0XZU0_OTOGA